ncbi:type I-E CRISPR-associated protein Cas5/CasD [Salinisphaera sp. RV14]|uniref:type I-E CRISPR-associated protein Cas5/CasD n=1 Tax=unclassified Salinisphaera TaxID=2649847 RepID=UPI003F876A5D
MATLLMCLAGPMQSWGTTSRFDERDTQLEPSKSGVLGLVCAALGRDRTRPIADLAALRMAVRVDREGIPMRDYHTATGVVASSGKVDSNRTVVSQRYYLSDAVFLVALEGERELLARIHDALRAPHWSLCLGRKSFVPSRPVFMPDGLRDGGLLDALESTALLTERDTREKTQQRRVVIEDPDEGTVRVDQPIAPFSERRFGPRFVKTFDLELEVDDVSDTTDA